MCRYVINKYTECAHSKTDVFRCGKSDAGSHPQARTSKCLTDEDTLAFPSYPHCIACKRMGKGQPKQIPISSMAGRLVNLIDGFLGYNTKAKAKVPKPVACIETKWDPEVTKGLDSFFYWETPNDVIASTTPRSSLTAPDSAQTPSPDSTSSSSLSEESTDTESSFSHSDEDEENFIGISRGWGPGIGRRGSWFSYENSDEANICVGPHPNRSSTRPKPNSSTDDRDSLPSRRSSPSSTSSLVPQLLSIRSSKASAQSAELCLPGPVLRIPSSLYAGGRKRHAIYGRLAELEDADGESIELDIPSYRNSEDEGDIDTAGNEVDLNIPDYVSVSEEAAELDAETKPTELEATSAPAANPDYDGSFYGDVVTGLPETWDWEDSDTESVKSRSATPVRDELLFQHPSLRQNWSSGPVSSAVGAGAGVSNAPAPRAAGQPATHFEHFDIPVGGNEVPTSEGSLLDSISSFWA